ncbi:MAG: hypothetical protein AAGF89_17240, partial [Bacteroidota bacterium]
ASAYVDGDLGERPATATDRLEVLDGDQPELSTIGSLAVSNSVRRWPNSAALLSQGNKEYLLIAEQDGPAPKNARALNELKRGRFLSLVEVTNPTAPQLVDQLPFTGIPAAVAFRPGTGTFALTFIGNDSLVTGTVVEGQLRILTRSRIELPKLGQIPAIPHFTWHPSGQFAAVTLAGNDRVAFLRFDPKSAQPFTVWGNVMRSPPLPGVGYFTHNGCFFLHTSIGLTGDEEQAAYGEQTSILSIIRFDSTETADSPPARRNDGQLTFLSPAVSHTKSGQYAFGRGYVETFAISPDDRLVIGLNMRASWLPEQAPGQTENSRLEAFTLDAERGIARWLGGHDFAGILPECIAFTAPRELATVSFDHLYNNRGRGSLDRWRLVENVGGSVEILEGRRRWLGRGAHFFLVGGQK